MTSEDASVTSGSRSGGIPASTKGMPHMALEEIDEASRDALHVAAQCLELIDFTARCAPTPAGAAASPTPRPSAAGVSTATVLDQHARDVVGYARWLWCA